MAGSKLTDAERDQIATMLRSGATYTTIRRATGRANATIARISKDIGHSAEQSTASRTREARRARSAYSAEVRAGHAAEAQTRLGEMLERFHDSTSVAVSTSRGAEVVEMPATARDYRDRANAIHALQRTVLDIRKADAVADESPQAALIVQFVDAIRNGTAP